MSLTFNMGGRLMTADEFKAQAAQAPKPAPRETLKSVTDRNFSRISMGFTVTGYPPLEIAQAKEAHNGPEPFDLAAYARKNKPTEGRIKPFEIESAADDCAALLKRMGWHLVTVTERMKG